VWAFIGVQLFTLVTVTFPLLPVVLIFSAHARTHTQGVSDQGDLNFILF